MFKNGVERSRPESLCSVAVLVFGPGILSWGGGSPCSPVQVTHLLCLHTGRFLSLYSRNSILSLGYIHFHVIVKYVQLVPVTPFSLKTEIFDIEKFYSTILWFSAVSILLLTTSIVFSICRVYFSELFISLSNTGLFHLFHKWECEVEVFSSGLPFLALTVWQRRAPALSPQTHLFLPSCQIFYWSACVLWLVLLAEEAVRIQMGYNQRLYLHCSNIQDQRRSRLRFM